VSALAERLEVVVELTKRQAELGKRELDVLLAIAASEAPVAQRRSRELLRSGQGCLLERPGSWTSYDRF